ncbi:MAG: YgiQ family radical SAM protein [Planctomycetota bacterium]
MTESASFIPMSLEEAREQGIARFDVVIVTADAYVDHPAFGAAIIGRFLQSLGLGVGIISRPDWRKAADFRKLGAPKYFFGVTAGNLDSMVALYTAGRKARSEDDYSEGGQAGRRPYLPTVVYSRRLRELFPDVPIVLGGIEASLRRICHYDHYHDKLRQSILLDARADLLVYGNAEAGLAEIVKGLTSGRQMSELRDIRGTVVPLESDDLERTRNSGGIIVLPSFEAVSDDRRQFMDMTKLVLENMSPFIAKPLFQASTGRGVIVNPPAMPLSTAELDRIYELPFTRKPHPSYKKEIPAIRTVDSSFVSHRGCFGGCAFCALSLHQGKFIQSRSPASVVREIGRFVNGRRPDPQKAKGIIITDVGGPTANMYGLECLDAQAMKACRRRSCLYPSICRHLKVSHAAYRGLIEAVSGVAGVKSVYVNSGVRFDLALADPAFIRDLSARHTQGRLSVAPEHVDPQILKLMEKADISVFDRFTVEFYSRSGEAGREQFVVPYFIVGHPGADDRTERNLAEYVRKKKIRPDQIQEFYPTPMTLATAMYYAGVDIDGHPIAVERETKRRRLWKDMVQQKTGRPGTGHPASHHPIKHARPGAGKPRR